MNETKAEILGLLWKQGAIKYGNFTLRSGNPSNYYIQLRDLSSYNHNIGRVLLKKIGNEMGQLIRACVPHVTRLVGVAYAGIPITVAITMETGLPSCYTRKEIKSHGIPRYIEGELRNGDNIVIVDDLVTSGESKLEARDAIKKECDLRNIEVFIDGIACLFDREEGAAEYLQTQGLNLYPYFKASDALDGV